MRRTNSGLFSMVVFVIVGTILLSGSVRAMERPFILWDKKDIAAIRKRIETNWSTSRNDMSRLSAICFNTRLWVIRKRPRRTRRNL
ncbi:MAG: hypothetical protein ACYSU5_13700 [Planctomycetota bacterium]